MMTKRLIAMAIAGLLNVSASALPTLAQDDGLPSIDIYKAMLDANKASGWVQFRNFNGQQILYFTPLVTMHCRLEEVRYSLNSDDLGQLFPLPECNPALPFSLPSDAGLDDIAISLPLGSAKFISVQVSYTGGKKQSGIVRFGPCADVGERTCGQLISETAAE